MFILWHNIYPLLSITVSWTTDSHVPQIYGDGYMIVEYV